MILRAWSGWTAPERADAYRRFLLGAVRPQLERLPGFRGLYLLRREAGAEVEHQVLTLWDSMDAIRGFAGDHAARAVVEPEAAALMTRFDREVRHYDVLDAPGGGSGLP